MLLEAGADPNTTLRGDETALMTAARTGKLGPVKALLARGADVNAKERRGQTALMWAAAEGHAEVVEALLQAGADFRTPLPSGFTPLFFAVREGRTDVVRVLLKAGADVNEAMQPKKSSGQGTAPGDHAVDPGRRERPLRAGGRPAGGGRRPERPAIGLHGAAHADLGPQAEPGRRRERRPRPDRLREPEQPPARREARGARGGRQRAAQAGRVGARRPQPGRRDAVPAGRR